MIKTRGLVRHLVLRYIRLVSTIQHVTLVGEKFEIAKNWWIKLWQIANYPSKSSPAKVLCCVVLDCSCISSYSCIYRPAVAVWSSPMLCHGYHPLVLLAALLPPVLLAILLLLPTILLLLPTILLLLVNLRLHHWCIYIDGLLSYFEFVICSFRDWLR